MYPLFALYQTLQRSFHSSAPARADNKDPYKVLGVAKNATASEIKKRYYEVSRTPHFAQRVICLLSYVHYIDAHIQLARKHHPDTNKDSKDAKDRFVEIQAAWDVSGILHYDASIRPGTVIHAVVSSSIAHFPFCLSYLIDSW